MKINIESEQNMTGHRKNEFLPVISLAEKDVQSLLNRTVALFDQNDGLRFEFFTQIWQDMKFPWIFLGHESFRHLYEFTEDLLTLIKGHLILSDNDFAFRAATLYTLYAVYWKQPIRPRLRIRLNQDEYTSCQRFIEECREEHHWDLIYCWIRLLSTYAIEFTGPSLIMGAEAGVTWDSRLNSQDSRNNLTYRLNPFSSQEIQSVFGQMTRTHEHYMTIRNALKSVDPQSEAGLSLVSEDLPEVLDAIQNNITGGGSSLRETKNPDPKDNRGKEGDNNVPKETTLSIGDRRQQLIKGAFATGGETSRQKQLKLLLPETNCPNDPDYVQNEDLPESDSMEDDDYSPKHSKKSKTASSNVKNRMGATSSKDHEDDPKVGDGVLPPIDRLEMELVKAENRLKQDDHPPLGDKESREKESITKPKGRPKKKAKLKQM